MSIIENILLKLFKHEDITDPHTGALYLRRFFISPRDPETKKDTPRLYLHKFFLGDSDRDLHDHPWPFKSLILKGGYWEHRINPIYQKWCQDPDRLPEEMPQETLVTWYGSGSLLTRGAKWTHKVELPQGRTAWTLVRTGVKERDWGFHTILGWCLHSNYRNGICWCGDTPTADTQK
jgi:hypothetical protein